tara:strand:- start:8053 stop:10164 length:2112 start_codon:yes stop_codon:yes gene_type:complete
MPFNFSPLNHCLIITCINASTLVNVLYAGIDKALVESTILINLPSLTDGSHIPSISNQRRLSDTATTSIQSVVDLNQSALPDTTALISSLTKTFNSFTDENLGEALEYAVSYLVDNKTNFNLNDDSLLAGINASMVSYINSSLAKSEDISANISIMPEIIYSNIIPKKVISWNENVSYWSRKISEQLARSLNESDLNSNKYPNQLKIIDQHQRNLVRNSIKSLLKILSEATESGNGFTGSISTVNSSRNEPNQQMMFDGIKGFMKFDPEKSRFLEFASKGLTDGLLYQNINNLSDQNVEGFAKILGEESMKGVAEQFFSLAGDNTLFAFEATKSISTGLTLGLVYNTSGTEIYRENNLATKAAESISQSLSYQIISSSIEKANGYALNRLAESVAFGTSMGAQLASVLDKSWDYEEGWEMYSRNELAKATAKGSANGSIDAASIHIQNDPTIADSANKTTREEILSVASGAALGSSLGNTALAVYYPTLLQPIINNSSQGSTYGGITAKNLSFVDKPQGVTEEFEIEIARAIAHGAAHGALFQVVGLKKDSLPDKRTYDFETISAAEAVSYGSTYGAITGGITSGEDGLIIKQAIYQGTTEGATVGASLALGYNENVADSVNFKSAVAMKSAIKKTNDEAAVKANSTMAVKTIQTSSQDMLLLMRKFNINPLYTNPTKIFSNPNAADEDNLPFENKFPFASPI